MDIVTVSHVSKTYSRHGAKTKALDDVSFSLERGSSLGIVGESGSGKTTLSKIVCSFERADEGSVCVAGISLPAKRLASRRKLYRHVQAIFQHPIESFDPKRTLGQSITEGLLNVGASRSEAENKMLTLLARVGLHDEYAHRYPHQVSGGECQRAAIARALMVEPELLVCDEATSSLDVSAQAQVICLLKDVRRSFATSLLFISHDLAVVQNLCSHIVVMRHGRIVEQGTADDIVNRPREPYTRILLESVPVLDDAIGDERCVS